MLRPEVLGLLDDTSRTIIVVLTPAAPPPHLWDLPERFARLSTTQALTISSGTWDLVLEQIIRTIRPVLRSRPR